MTRWIGWREIFVGGLVAGALGCGDDGGDVSLDEAPAAIAQSICGPLEECLGPLAVLFLGGQDCVDALEPGIVNGSAPLWQRSIDEGRLAYDGSALPDCVDAVTAMGCGASSSRDVAACERAFEGLVEPGGACIAEVDCTGEAYCAFDAACPGVCTPRAGGGASCTEDAGCQSGFDCSGGRCVTPADAGDACEGGTGIACALGLLCTGATDTEAGTCTAYAAVFTEPLGASCNLVDGLMPLCEEGLSCVVDDFDFATMEVIQSCAAPSSSGGACKLGFPEVCPAGEYCDANPMAGVFEGDCQPLPAAGEPCREVAAEGLGQACAAGHACVGGRCEALQANGASCTGDAACYSGHCESGTCAAPSCG